MAAGSGTKGSGTKKHGRNLRKPACSRYTNQMRWVTNKIKKLKRHLKSHSTDKSAIKALKTATEG